MNQFFRRHWKALLVLLAVLITAAVLYIFFLARPVEEHRSGDESSTVVQYDRALKDL